MHAIALSRLRYDLGTMYLESHHCLHGVWPWKETSLRGLARLVESQPGSYLGRAKEHRQLVQS